MSQISGFFLYNSLFLFLACHFLVSAFDLVCKKSGGHGMAIDRQAINNYKKM